MLVATVRALKMHGGADKGELDREDVATLDRGLANLDRHVRNLRRFGVPVVVALNRFAGDGAGEVARVLEHCRDRLGVPAHACDHFARGGAGAEALAESVAALAEGGAADFRPLYPAEAGLWAKIEAVARELYGAERCEAAPRVEARLAELERLGYGTLPVCMAKTPYSFSTDPSLRGAPSGHVVPVRDVRLAAGAGFVVVLCGEVMTMPGLPRRPAATRIGLDAEGRIQGLF